MAYTNATKTRREAGFFGNTNINDTLDIQPKVDEANGRISAAVGLRYALPLSTNTNYTGSEAENMLVSMATELAKCYLLISQYAGQSNDESKQLNISMKAIYEKLDQISSGKLKLFGTDGVELILSSGGQIGLFGFPNSYEDNPPMFYVEQEF